MTEHILIVEDDSTHRAMMHEILVELGFHVTSSDNGYTALAKIAAHPHRYALVVMDWEMPEMDGLEAVRTIRARQLEEGWPYIPVIAFTGNKQPGDKEQCLAAGMDDYLPKEIFLPKWRESLNEKIAYWIESANDR